MTDTRRWVIDVCKTCDRLAHYPFCEHRPEHGSYVDPPPLWYETITVRKAGR
jgi:hypothetical protein